MCRTVGTGDEEGGELTRQVAPQKGKGGARRRATGKGLRAERGSTGTPLHAPALGSSAPEMAASGFILSSSSAHGESLHTQCSVEISAYSMLHSAALHGIHKQFAFRISAYTLSCCILLAPHPTRRCRLWCGVVWCGVVCNITENQLADNSRLVARTGRRAGSGEAAGATASFASSSRPYSW